MRMMVRKECGSLKLRTSVVEREGKSMGGGRRVLEEQEQEGKGEVSSAIPYTREESRREDVLSGGLLILDVLEDDGVILEHVEAKAEKAANDKVSSMDELSVPSSFVTSSLPPFSLLPELASSPTPLHSITRTPYEM